MAKTMTVLSSNLLNCVRHDTEDRQLWTFLHDCPSGKWHTTETKPVSAGKDDFGRSWLEIEVLESFDDAESMLTAERDAGFHSWQAEMIDQALESYVFNPK